MKKIEELKLIIMEFSRNDIGDFDYIIAACREGMGNKAIDCHRQS